MKIFLLIALISIERIATYSQDEIIFWNDKQPLKWEDFTGSLVETSGFYASTHSSIKYRYSYNTSGTIYNLRFDVSSYFIKGKSWTLKERQTPALLKHEQLHFDITELYARKLKEELEKQSYSNDFKDQVPQIFNAKKLELDSVQKRYDDETDHSMNKEKQKEWEVYINEELRKTRPTNIN